MRNAISSIFVLLIIALIGVLASSAFASSEGNVTVNVTQYMNVSWQQLITPEGVFEPPSSLSGTHFSMFSIRFVNLTIDPSSNLTCNIERPGGSLLRLSTTGLFIFNQNFSLNYTLSNSDPIINHANAGYLPWILKNCTIASGGTLRFNGTPTSNNSRIYVHSANYWADNEVTRAVTCEGTPGVYFNNTGKCEFSEDTLFALQMRNGNPVEPSCFNNPGVGCANDYCRGIYFPTCDPIDFFGGYSPLSDDPNNYATFTVSFAGYNTQIAYTRHVNSSGRFKMRVVQALTNKPFSFTIYNLTNVSATNYTVYGFGTGNGTLSATDQGDGTWSVAYYNFGSFTGTLDFVMSVPFTDPNISYSNRTLRLVIAYGTDTNQGNPALFNVTFNTTIGLRSLSESENSSIMNELGGVCGDRVNNDFDYLGSGGSWDNSYDCYDPDCDNISGDYSQTNEFGSNKTGLCNYLHERNCTDQFDNDYNDWTDCHDADCFHVDTACPTTETICNDGINNDWDYTNTDAETNDKIGNNGTRYGIVGYADLTDCEDPDCDGLVGGPAGQLCNWGYETNCSDGFNNDAMQMKDCELATLGGTTTMPSVSTGEYDCSNYCRQSLSTETGAACDNNKDDDWDAIVVTGYYTGVANTASGAGIDCRWGGYFGIGSDYNPDEDCNMTILGSGKRCELMRELTCNDSFDNDFDHDAAGMPHAGWSANATAYQAYFGTAFVNYGDYDDYDCAGVGAAPASESINASWCFDGIDNDLDAYYFTGSGYAANASTGKDCYDPDCAGVTNPANENQTCLSHEYDPTDLFFMLLPDPAKYCKNNYDDDVDNSLGWPLGGIDCTDPDCNKRFGMCSGGPCYESERIAWDSCMNSIDDDHDMPSAKADCADSACTDASMIGSASGAVCQAAESDCNDGFDNDADGSVDCADSDCAGLVGGMVNGTVAYCRASESTQADCFDGFDNDADGLLDCYESSCNAYCNLTTITGMTPITLPTMASAALNGVTAAYVQNYTRRIRNGEWYNVTMKMTAASTNAQWTLGTVNGKFNKSAFNASTAYLSGPNAANFTLSETVNGFIVSSNHSNLTAGYTVIFNIKSNSTLASSTYEVTYAEEAGSQTSMNNYIYHECVENVPPAAQLIQASPHTGWMRYGGAIYLRANISDNYQLGRCDWNITGPQNFAPPSSTQCRASFSPTQEGTYHINVTPVDYYSNVGAPITKTLNVNIVPTASSIQINKTVPFYNQTSETLTINATFNVPGTDSLGTCSVIAKSLSGSETTLATFAATGSSCIKSNINLSALPDGQYKIFVRVTETTESDIVESGTKALFACSSLQGVCELADYDANGVPDSCALKPNITVTLLDPVDNYNTTEVSVTFRCMARSNTPVQSITLYIWNESGVYYANTTINGTANATTASWNVTSLNQTTYAWNCFATDSANASAWADANRTVTFGVVAAPAAPPGRPPVLPPIGVPCVENWVCTEWTLCSPDGYQTRECVETNNCAAQVAEGKAGWIQTTGDPEMQRQCKYAPSCDSGYLDAGETDVDCGGVCKPCENNRRCESDEDCESGFCHNGVCKQPTCYDLIQNQGEEHTDCGGPCASCPVVAVPVPSLPYPTMALVMLAILLAVIAVALFALLLRSKIRALFGALRKRAPVPKKAHLGLAKYIAERARRGDSATRIRNRLRELGWDDESIDTAFRQIKQRAKKR